MLGKLIVGRAARALATALAMTLTGCGQKGPLTLPPAATAPAQAAPAPHDTAHRPDGPR
nr:lipoprotein [Tepidimonas sediminis]